MMKRILSFAMSLWVVLAITACGGSSSEPTATTQTTENIELEYTDLPLGLNEVKHISGTTSIESQGFALEGPGVLSVFWRQDCERFGLGMRNTNETLAESPGGTLYFEAAAAPSEYVEPVPWAVPYEYIPGEYQFVIDAAGDDCQWEVWAVVEYPDQ